MGHIFSRDSIKAELVKVSSILNMPSPSKVEELRQILRMIHFLGSYVPDLASIAQPLNELLKSKVIWTWGPGQEQALSQIRNLLSSSPVLSYYDATKKTVYKLSVLMPVHMAGQCSLAREV